MKAFSSSILSTKQAPIMESASVGTFNSFESNKSNLVKFLEFNEAAAEADIQSTRDFYLNLMRAGMNGTGYDPALEACFKQYEAVRMAAMNCLVGPDCVPVDENKPAPVLKLEQLKKVCPAETIVQTYCTTSACDVSNDAALVVFDKFCKDVVNNPKSLNGKVLGEEVVAYMSKCIGLDETDSIGELLDEITNSFTINEREVNISNFNFYDCYRGCSIYVFMNDIAKISDPIISYLRVNADKFEDPNEVRAIIRCICDAISAYAIITMKCNQISSDMYKKVYEINAKRIMEFTSDSGIAESMSLFGDEIDSKSVFDDLEPSDFNPTEFMNLELLSEHAMKMDSMETYKWAMSMEAKYLAEQNYQGLVDLNEAVGQKIKEGFRKVIDAIKKIAAKFVEAIMFNFGTEKAWLTKYKNIILNNELNPNTEITIYCNLGNAVDKIAKVVCPMPNYAELTKGDNDKFASEQAFFEKEFGNFFPNMDKADYHVPKDGSIADRCKIYLGAKYPDGQSENITFDKFGQGELPTVAQMYDWLLNTDKLAKNTQAQIKNIERAVDNYVKSAEKLGAPENQQNNNSQNNDQNNQQQGSNNAAQNSGNNNTNQSQNNNAKQESYYSYIYGKMLTEMDIKSAPANNSGDNNNQSQDMNGSKETYKNTRGDTDAQVKNSNDSASVITGRMNIYLKVCKQVLTAKMTAINYAHKEMLDLMRAIVKGRLGDSADIQLKSQADNNQQNQNNDNNANEGDNKPEVTSNATGGGRLRRAINTLRGQ